ncbi:hypothetical protein [Aeromonas salmonicida]|uniref:hypothetical protein n=1 Tax=Aeromonas salmonicida TaxID=645 RepID=UPI003CEDD0A1
MQQIELLSIFCFCHHLIRQSGGNILVVALVGFSMLRELAPLRIAIIGIDSSQFMPSMPAAGSTALIIQCSYKPCFLCLSAYRPPVLPDLCS